MSHSGMSEIQHVTVPLHLEHHRPFVDFACAGVDGCSHPARFWIDTGGGSLVITEALARRLGVSWQEVFESSEGRHAPFVLPSLTLAGMPVNLEHVQSFVSLGPSAHLAPGVFADGLIGGPFLAQYQVIFDYPHRQFTLAAPGSLAPKGPALPTPIHPQSGFARVEVQIDEQTYGMLLDTGASHTMISRTVLDELAASHPSWPHALETAGTANMGFAQVDLGARMLRLPELIWGPYSLMGASVVSRPSGVFEERMARMMAGPIFGALGGNLLKCFRIEIDYAKQTSYLEQYDVPDTRDMDLVGLTLEPQMNGSYLVRGISTGGNDPQVAERIHVGDRLLRVDTQEITGLPLASAVNALRGGPGQEHLLQLERAGQSIEVSVPVARIL